MTWPSILKAKVTTSPTGRCWVGPGHGKRQDRSESRPRAAGRLPDLSARRQRGYAERAAPVQHQVAPRSALVTTERSKRWATGRSRSPKAADHSAHRFVRLGAGPDGYVFD